MPSQTNINPALCFFCSLLLAVVAGCAPAAPDGTAPDETAPDETGVHATSPAADQGENQNQAVTASDDQKNEGMSVTAEEVQQTPQSKTSPLYSPEAFRMAARDGRQRVVEMCVESGLDVNEADAKGITPLALAAFNGHDKTVRYLIANKALVDSRDQEQHTPLIHAAGGPAPTTVQILLDAGADINAFAGAENWTALMMAAQFGNIEVIKVLLAAGADKEIRDTDGDDAAHFAREQGHFEIVKLLEAK